MKNYGIMKKVTILVLSLLLVLAGACDYKDLSLTTSGVVETSEIVVTRTSLTFGAAASSQYVVYSITNPVEGAELTANLVDEEEAWVTTTVTSSHVGFSVEAYTEGSERTTTVVLSYPGAEDVEISITQNPSLSVAPAIQVETTSLSFEAESSSQSVSYFVDNSVEGEELTATADQDWVTATVSSSEITFEVEANAGAERTATVTLSYTGANNVTVSVTQGESGASIVVAESVTAPVEGATLSVPYTIENSSSSSSIVTATTTSNITWISSISSDASYVYFTVAASRLTEAREATFTLTLGGTSDATFTVVQSGISPGDYFCSSSSDDWYVVSKGSSNVNESDVLGIVFSVDSDRIGSAEKTALSNAGVSTPHGLVISKKNATDDATYWYAGGSAWQVTGSTVTTTAGLYSDISGYEKTQAVWSSDLYTSNSSRFPGFAAVQECNAGDNAYVSQAPTNTTGWFVPSSGQMWDFMENVAGWDLSEYRTSNVSAVDGGGLNVSGLSFDALKTCLDGLSDADSFVTEGATITDIYATSTEVSNSQVATANWNSNTYSVSIYGKQELGECEFRPVLAF